MSEGENSSLSRGRFSPLRIVTSQQRLIIATATFLVVTGNITFFTMLLQAYEPSARNIGFIISVPLVLGCLLVALSALLSCRFTTRPLLVILLIIASIVGHFSDQYGIVFDQAMLQNVLETNVSEAAELVSVSLVSRVLVLGILPAWLVCVTPLKYATIWQELRRKAAVIGACVLLISFSVAMYSAHYASFIREHKPIRHYTNPLHPLYAAVQLFSKRGFNQTTSTLTMIGGNARLPKEDPHRELMILVVGETARADRFSLNGYARKTNPRLEQEANIFSYTNVSACGTSTAVSVPCMFALDGRQAFDTDKARITENVLDVLQRAGVNVLWRDNNSGSKGVADRVTFENFSNPERNPICDPECRDEGMLSGLQQYIDQQQGDILVVLHQQGNHGPAYYKRYPARFGQFQPICKSVELSQCTLDEISNAYDNAILYTDYVLAKTVSLLKANSADFETAMLYVSDHGESLGEGGLFLHGAPYLIAPEQQTHVPVVLWLGPSHDVEVRSAIDTMSQLLSHDAVFNSLLKFFEVTSVLCPADRCESLFDVSATD